MPLPGALSGDYTEEKKRVATPYVSRVCEESTKAHSGRKEWEGLALHPGPDVCVSEVADTELRVTARADQYLLSL